MRENVDKLVIPRNFRIISLNKVYSLYKLKNSESDEQKKEVD